MANLNQTDMHTDDTQQEDSFQQTDPIDLLPQDPPTDPQPDPSLLGAHLPFHPVSIAPTVLANTIPVSSISVSIAQTDTSTVLSTHTGTKPKGSNPSLLQPPYMSFQNQHIPSEQAHYMPQQVPQYTDYSQTAHIDRNQINTRAYFNTHADDNTYIPTDSPDSMRHRRSLNIERLYYNRTNIPLLYGYDTDGNWKNVLLEQWLSLLEDLFEEENIVTDREKLAAYPRFLDPHGQARNVIQSNPELKRARTWQQFSTGLLNQLSAMTTETCFASYSRFHELKWTRGMVFSTYMADAQNTFDLFLKGSHQHFRETITPGMRKIFVNASIYNRLSPEFKPIIAEHFNPMLSFSDQAKLYMLKTANRLNNPYPTGSRSSSSRNESTVSNVRSQGGKNTNTSQNSSNPSRSNATIRNPPKPNQIVDPNRTPYCTNCERYAHSTNGCPFEPYCSTCRDYHPRGSTSRCVNTVWDRRTPEALRRVKYLSPQRGKKTSKSSSKGKPKRKTSDSRSYPNSGASSPTNSNRDFNQVRNQNSNFVPAYPNYNPPPPYYNYPPQQSRVFTSSRAPQQSYNTPPSQQRRPQPQYRQIVQQPYRQPVYYVQDNIPHSQEQLPYLDNSTPQDTRFEEYSNFPQQFENMSINSQPDDYPRTSSPYPENFQ